MATVIFGFADGRQSGEFGCCFFPGAFAEVLRLAEMHRAAAVWCLPLDIWGML
jgi:hypothetical protein